MGRRLLGSQPSDLHISEFSLEPVCFLGDWPGCPVNAPWDCKQCGLCKTSHRQQKDFKTHMHTHGGSNA